MHVNPTSEDNAWKKAIIDQLNGSFVTSEHLIAIQAEIGLHLPKFLYRFRSASNVNHIESLLAFEEWMASPLTFNDPYDSAFCLSLEELASEPETSNELNGILKRTGLDAMLGDEFHQVSHSPNPFPTLIDILAKKGILDEKSATALNEVIVWSKDRMHDEMRDATRVCCLSEDFGSTTMWSHYADNHRGFVIEYETASLPKEYRASLFPVSYREFVPTTDEIFITRTKVNSFWRIAAACIKAVDWAYEREWRMITWNTAFPESSKGSAHPIKMPKPSRVLLGAKIKATDRHLIEHLCRTKGIPSFPVRREPGRFRIAQPTPLQPVPCRHD
jgi:hypothetical protein